jgi:hypothetical protein
MTTCIVYFTTVFLQVGIHLPTVKSFRLELEVCITLGNCLKERLKVPNRLADGDATVRLQHAFEACRDDGRGFYGETVPVDQLHVGPRTAAILWGCRTLAPDADRIATLRVARQDGFQADLSCPVIDDIVDVGEVLPTV